MTSKMPWKPRTKNILGVSALVLLLALTGLGSWLIWNWGDNESSNDGGVDQSQEKSPSPSPSQDLPPEFPAEAYLADEVGIEATVRYEIEGQNYAYRTNNTEPLEVVYDVKACEVCFNVIDATGDRRDANHRVIGGQISITAVRNVFNFGYLAGSANQAGVVDVEYTQAESRMVNEAGEELEKYGAQQIVARYSVIYRDGHWVVTAQEQLN